MLAASGRRNQKGRRARGPAHSQAGTPAPLLKNGIGLGVGLVLNVLNLDLLIADALIMGK